MRPYLLIFANKRPKQPIKVKIILFYAYKCKQMKKALLCRKCQNAINLT